MGGLGLGLSLEGSAQFKINHKMVLNDEDGTYGQSFNLSCSTVRNFLYFTYISIFRRHLD